MQGLPPSLYAKILGRLQSFEGEIYPFHIGETHLLPTPEVMDSLRNVEEPSIHHYGHPQGLPALREEIAARAFAHDTNLQVTADEVLVTHGATHGLHLACQAILDPGDVMLVLSPHWPLINHMVHTACAVPNEVPFTSELRDGHDVDTYALLKRHHTLRARAVYVTSPNNPDGVVLNEKELEGIARFCVEHDLYALVDEAYERFHFTERSRALASFEGMRDRTITVYTFSKSHRMAGLRIGYTIAPLDVRLAMTKLANISIYNVSMHIQRAALRALTCCDASVDETRAAALAASKQFCAALRGVDGVRFQAPEGGAYVFADLSERCGEQPIACVLERCLDEGVVFAPGSGFGAAYPHHARFCFTAMAPDHLARGTERLISALRSFG